MKFKVLSASQIQIEVWDGTTIDKWRNPVPYTLFGDFSAFTKDDLVEIVVRKLA